MIIANENKEKSAMKFQIKKKNLFDALQRMHSVATKGIRSEFNKAGQATIEASPGKISFVASNGNMDAHFEIKTSVDANVKEVEPGKVTINIGVAKGIVKAIGGRDSDDHVLSLELNGGVLFIQDTEVKKNKKISTAKMETINEHFNLKFKKSAGFSYSFDSLMFKESVGCVGKYISPMTHDVRFQMICLHFIDNQVRFVCGDGHRFAVLSHPLPEGFETPDEAKYLVPVDQLQILSQVLEGSSMVTFTFENKSTYHVQLQNGMQLILKGIPDEKYIGYENHAFRHEEAQVAFDLNRKDLSDAMSLVQSVRDPEIEKQGNFLTVKLSVAADTDISLRVDENKYQCDYSCPVSFYALGDLTSLSSPYAAHHLSDVANSVESEYVRFYCLDEGKTVIAAMVDLHGTEKDDKGMPLLMPRENGGLLLFFANVLDNKAE